MTALKAPSSLVGAGTSANVVSRVADDETKRSAWRASMRTIASSGTRRGSIRTATSDIDYSLIFKFGTCQVSSSSRSTRSLPSASRVAFLPPRTGEE
eukprot:2540654-Prymnesium_polylepis.1